MKKKYIREQRRRYLKKVAASYYLEQRKFKTFKGWSKVTNRLKNQSVDIFAKIKTHYASEILLEHICYPFYVQNSKADGI
jgi:predicted nucleic acid-binding OB-fold protein